MIQLDVFHCGATSLGVSLNSHTNTIPNLTNFLAVPFNGGLLENLCTQCHCQLVVMEVADSEAIHGQF